MHSSVVIWLTTIYLSISFIDMIVNMDNIIAKNATIIPWFVRLLTSRAEIFSNDLLCSDVLFMTETSQSSDKAKYRMISNYLLFLFIELRTNLIKNKCLSISYSSFLSSLQLVEYLTILRGLLEYRSSSATYKITDKTIGFHDGDERSVFS